MRLLLKLLAGYALFALSYSFVSLIHPQPALVIHDYARPFLVLELSGHFLFGVVAALPLLDPELILLTGFLAIAIDLDHVPIALGLQVSGNPDHSILFALLSSIVLLSIAYKQLGSPSGVAEKQRRNLFLVKVLLVGPIVLLSHIAFDLFAGWYYYQPFIPFDFAIVALPQSLWVVLELLAFSLAVSSLAYGMLKKRKTARIADLGKTSGLAPGKN